MKTHSTTGNSVHGGIGATAIDSRKNGKLNKTYKCDMCSALIIRGKRCKACSYEAVLKQGRTQ